MDRPRPAMRSSGRSVDWADAMDDQLMDEAVLQISGAGHWFLEGWIGDHSVDFLVDSGSAVTAIQPVMDQPSRPSCDPLMLPDHLQGLLDQTSHDLDDSQSGQLANTLL